MESSGGLTQVRILNQVYSVRSGDDAAYVRELADYVDQRLQHVSDVAPTVDTLKVAILGALNIADELFRLRKSESESDLWCADRLRECHQMLDEIQDPDRLTAPEVDL